MVMFKLIYVVHSKLARNMLDQFREIFNKTLTLDQNENDVTDISLKAYSALILTTRVRGANYHIQKLFHMKKRMKIRLMFERKRKGISLNHKVFRRLLRFNS